MEFAAFFGLAAANFVASVAPGQNAALIVGAGARGGARAGVAALGGILTAEAVWVALALAATVGLLAHVDPAPLTLAGGVVLVALGLWSLAQRPGVVLAAARPHLGGLIAQGAAVGFANPLALAFFVAVFPQFLPGPLTPEAAAAAVAAILLSSAAGCAIWLCASAWLIPPGRALLLHRGSAAAIVVCGALALMAPVEGAVAAADLMAFGGAG
jgi:threonine/homoserine/homoserine lactone efflux protein